MQAATDLPDYPGGFRGTGIVTCGANKYLPYLWILVRSVRRVRCRLPIELWHLRGEVDEHIEELFAPYDVTFRCADELEGFGGAVDRPVFMIKPWSILHSRFRHVLFLDADNSVFCDPSFLFATSEYLEHGAVFWPDIVKFRRKLGSSASLGGRGLFRDFGVRVDWSREFETGQIVVDKKRHWRGLQLTMHLNAEHAYYYQYLLGDKDTFRLAFELAREPYHFVPTDPVHCLARVDGPLKLFSVLQRWPAAKPVFAHSLGGWRKWLRGDLLTPAPYCLPNVPHDFLEQILAELRERWRFTTSDAEFTKGQLFLPLRRRASRRSGAARS